MGGRDGGGHSALRRELHMAPQASSPRDSTPVGCLAVRSLALGRGAFTARGPEGLRFYCFCSRSKMEKTGNPDRNLFATPRLFRRRFFDGLAILPNCLLCKIAFFFIELIQGDGLLSCGVSESDSKKDRL